MITRIVTSLGAVALLATLSVGTAGASRPAAGTIIGSGSSFDAPLSHLRLPVTKLPHQLSVPRQWHRAVAAHEKLTDFGAFDVPMLK